ncbi:SPOR domain-containing protein [Rhodoferax ferrireducens]|uniref:SPOR domain-containing protein n=1 Tax=Rhodoferax ferrireducens TaxID=192843 RepID=UPI0018E4E593|nr:SPOR domain-containing protein [Rhodoferax ferrireducens]
MSVPTAAAMPDATSLDSSEESAITVLYRAAVGSVNADYYLPVFTRFEAADRASLSWNWAASLYTLNWMAFRQLWGAALIYASAMLGTAILVFVMGSLLFRLSETVVLSLLLALGVLSFVLPGVYGNAFLYAQARKRMARALSASPTLAQAAAMLNRQASSRRQFVRLGLVNVLLAAAAVAVYFAFFDGGKSSPVSPPVAEVRNFAQGRATDLTPIPGAVPVSIPISVSASAPVPVASAPLAAPVLPTSTPQLMLPPVSASVPTTAKHFYVNVGLFSEESNARKAFTKLQDAGLAAFSQELETRQGKRIRVRVGPFEAKSDAHAAAAKIHALRLEAVVFSQ